MVDIVSALDELRGQQERGFTFLDAAGAGQDRFVSFHALRADVARCAANLRARGLDRGDRIALVLPDGADFIPVFLGALWTGIVPIPLYPPVSLMKLEAFMETLLGILRVSTPRAIVTDGLCASLLGTAVGRVPSLEQVMLADELRAQVAGDDAPPAPRAPADVAFLQFTSGSTSAPKGVIVTHGSVAANCRAILHGLEVDPQRDSCVSWLPLYHDMGLIGCVLGAIAGRVPTAYIPPLSFIKTPTIWLEALSRRRATITFAPNFAYALVTRRLRASQLEGWDLSRLRVLGCGAEAINPDAIRRFFDLLAPTGLRPEAFLPAYGMAEATLAMSFAALDEPMRTVRIDRSAYHARRAAHPAGDAANSYELVNCGRPPPGHDLSIRDDSGELLPERSVGEICFRGPSVTAGYWNDPEATRAAGLGQPGSWLRTGDLGFMVGGEVFISGRIKDVLIIHGRNYYPQIIEWVVDEIDGARRGSAVAFSRPGPLSEELVIAVETRESNLARMADEVRSRVNETLGLAVADIVFLGPGTLPKTSSGKLQRSMTREQYLNGALRSRSPAEP
jgi:fatty-acyl-CoA synthase